jgi:dTDP-4-dehydrorhamnose reductase
VQIVILGAAGQLGRELARALPDAMALTRADLDIADAARVDDRLGRLDAGTVVVNATAENRVDHAETDATDAVAVNVLGVAHLARVCRARNAVLVHVSTDYVFDGRASRPYTEDDVPHPLGAYARSKLAGELVARALAPRHAIVRTAGLYAAGGSRGKGGSFVDRVLEKARRGEPLQIVDDQVTAPTWTRDLATALVRLLPRLATGDAPTGVYHVTNTGACSWYDFARAALELAGVTASVTPITSAALAAPAPRPPYSVLANARLAALGEPPLRSWRDALAAYLASR